VPRFGGVSNTCGAKASFADQAGVDPEIRFRLLWHDVHIAGATGATASLLQYLVQRATQHVEVLAHMHFEIAYDAEVLVVREDGRLLSAEPDPRGVLEALYRRVHELAFSSASRAGWVRVHAVTVDVAGGRVALVGPAGVGKTTLAARLLFDGAAVSGDESALLRDGSSLAFPRPFHLKPGIDELVPELGPLVPEMPVVVGHVPVRAFDPTTAGFGWEIAAAQVDHVVVVGRVDRIRGSALEIVGATTAMHDIIEQVFPLHESKTAIVREVAAVLRRARCYRLLVDDPASASALVRQLGT
jgi:hypothetical protein